MLWVTKNIKNSSFKIKGVTIYSETVEGANKGRQACDDHGMEHLYREKG